MTQAELEREVARMTGEPREEIRRRGFQLVVMPRRRPRVVNWDQVQSRRRCPVNGSRRPVAA